ncbi:hypothetical protein QBC38DRAFT_443869 [Podospora fimiseda]|uniref:Uncharacterized protein n=1 Tax=Podospora fimiseda TaxID=252190 RepID=A0AAN7BPV6_9PEZI|nr:hypothetical protein QBC38DRAFT_443869 [Podospora fimiseda]
MYLPDFFKGMGLNTPIPAVIEHTESSSPLSRRSDKATTIARGCYCRRSKKRVPSPFPVLYTTRKLAEGHYLCAPDFHDRCTGAFDSSGHCRLLWWWLVQTTTSEGTEKSKEWLEVDPEAPKIKIDREKLTFDATKPLDDQIMPPLQRLPSRVSELASVPKKLSMEPVLKQVPGLTGPIPLMKIKKNQQGVSPVAGVTKTIGTDNQARVEKRKGISDENMMRKSDAGSTLWDYHNSIFKDAETVDETECAEHVGSGRARMVTRSPRVSVPIR